MNNYHEYEIQADVAPYVRESSKHKTYRSALIEFNKSVKSEKYEYVELNGRMFPDDEKLSTSRILKCWSL